MCLPVSQSSPRQRRFRNAEVGSVKSVLSFLLLASGDNGAGSDEEDRAYRDDDGDDADEEEPELRKG
ncbi:hypothetical protein HDE_13793 [Halotydeus destructor]|nr:hypothetical protein HDE_13793 [Halotydeus destructor]